MKKYASYACILAAAACWGCIGLFNRPLLNAGIAPENLVVIRNLGGLAVLALFFLCTDRSVFKMKAKHLPIFIATGIISVVLFTLCYFNAQKLCSLSVSAILLYTAPAMVVLMSALVFKEKITGKKLLALALALLGCALVTGVFTGGLSLTTKGLFFGLGAAFFYALYSIFAPFGLRHYSPLAVVFWTFVFAALGALFVADWGNLMTVLSKTPSSLRDSCFSPPSRPTSSTPRALPTSRAARPVSWRASSRSSARSSAPSSSASPSARAFS